MESSNATPVDTGRKLNVHKTFIIRPGRLVNILCTFNLRPVSAGTLWSKNVFKVRNIDFVLNCCSVSLQTLTNGLSTGVNKATNDQNKMS